MSHVSLIDDSSLLILVGGGRVPRFAPNKVILWDEEAKRLIQIPSEESREASNSFDESSLKASTIFSVGQEEKDAARSVSLSDLGSESDTKRVVDTDAIHDLDADLQSTSAHSRAQEGEVDTSASVDDNQADVIGLHPTSASVAPHVRSSEELPPHPSLHSTSRTNDRADSTRLVTLKGREVAELEFGEAVKGVCVKTFDIPDSDKNKAGKSTLLVILLDSKAIVFELGTHIQYEAQEIPIGSSESRSWGIRQRLVVEIHSGLERGLASMAPIPDSSCVLLVLPGRQTGHVQILSIALSNAGRTSIRPSIAGASTIIAAHANAISSLTLSVDGRILCTTSERGTLLRLWSTFSSSSRDPNVTNLSTSLLCELRRGSDSAKIWSVAFSPDSLLLAVGSDKGTIHFFNLQPLHEALHSTSVSRSSSPLHPSTPSSNTPALLGKKGSRYLPTSVQQVANSIPPSMLPHYLKSQWSFAQYKVPLKVFSSSIVEDSQRPSQPLFSTRRRDKQKVSDDHEVAPAILSGKQASLEGGWAGMKGRIDDVRRGEKGIEEGLWLTWIASDLISSEEKSDAKTAKSRPTFSTSTTKDHRHALRSCKYELIAISSSGSHYRIGVALPRSAHSSSSPSSKKTKSTVLDMYKEEKGTTRSDARNAPSDEDELGKDLDQDQCWLIEYRRFGMRDDWID